MRFERTAFGVGVQRSIQLSYGRGYKRYYTIFHIVCKASGTLFYPVALQSAAAPLSVDWF